MRSSKFLAIVILFFSLLFYGNQTYATHIVGGEITYKRQANNIYAIKMSIYRDCFNGVPPFDDPAGIGIFDQNNILVQSFGVNVDPDSVRIPSIINNACATVGNICYEK